MTAEARLPTLREATRQYLLEALPAGQFLAWVAEAAGKIVATSGLIFFQKPPSEQNLTGLEAYILNMYTLPAWRGQGLARRLLQVLLDAARARQAHRIWPYATPDGQPLYAKAGFVPRHRKNLEMELLR